LIDTIKIDGIEGNNKTSQIDETIGEGGKKK
jgi:hypothetical protein